MLDVEVGSDSIVCQINSFFTKEGHIDHLNELEDILVKEYQNQKIIFEDRDGNNINLPQFRSWLARLRTALVTDPNKIVFATQIPPMDPYTWIQRHDYYQICQINYKKLNKDLSNARFVGCLNGSRPSMPRIRMTYELGQAFQNSAYLTCWVRNTIDRLKQTNEKLYSKEIDWFTNYQFKNDLALPPEHRALDMYTASFGYAQIWNQFKVEVVCETDEYMHNRLTDKIAKPLASAKPFLLLCGQGSLQHLRDLGFVTFANYIDESYDACELPAQRIKKIVASLTELYHAPDRESRIQAMYQHAKHNASVYATIVTYTTPKSTATGFPVIPALK